MPRIVADLHCHSSASTHAYSTVGELVGVAAAKGLSALALTDHGPALPDAPHAWHFDNQRVLPRRVGDVVLLRGAEANIRTLTGDLDLEDQVLGMLDWVVASFHEPCLAPGTLAEHTEAYQKVLANPFVDALGHIGSIQFPFDVDTVVKACREAGKVIEINCGTFKVRPRSIPNCLRIAESCAKHGTSVVVTSDAHSHWDVGEFGPALALLDSIGFPEALILNADKDRLFRSIATRRGRSLS
jgi:putative hydrolase